MIFFFQFSLTKLTALKFFRSARLSQLVAAWVGTAVTFTANLSLKKKKEAKKKGPVFITPLIRLALQQYFGAVRLSLESSFCQVGPSLDPVAGNLTGFTKQGVCQQHGPLSSTNQLLSCLWRTQSWIRLSVFRQSKESCTLLFPSSIRFIYFHS